MNERVFISYAKPNLDAARKLVAALKSAGLDVWFDKDNLLAGEDWDSVIQREIRNSGVIIICLSSEIEERRGYFYKEMRIAMDVALTIPPNQLYIMPVKLNECPIPDQLSRYHTLDLFEEGAIDVLFKSLEKALGRGLSPATGDALHSLTEALTPPSFGNVAPPLSAFARSLLIEIISDTRSDPKGLMIISISSTEGAYVPYLHSHDHGALQPPIINIAKVKMAVRELESADILQFFDQGGAQVQYVLNPTFDTPGFLEQLSLTTEHSEPSTNPFNALEREMLVSSSEKGEISVTRTDAHGEMITVAKHLYFDQNDPAISAAAIEALQSLIARGFVRHENGPLFRLTGTGFAIARKLKTTIS